jgi:hypothetical protein
LFPISQMRTLNGERLNHLLTWLVNGTVNLQVGYFSIRVQVFKS